MATTRKRAWNPQPAKWLLQRRHISQQELGHRAGLHRTQMSMALNGRITPSWRMASALIDLLGEEPEALFDRELLEATRWYSGYRLRRSKGGVSDG